MKPFRYKNILLYATHQWCGNIEQYFSANSEKLVVFLLMPRVQNTNNILRIYKKGKIVKEEQISLSENFFMYYIMWNLQYARALLKYFSRGEKVTVISFHPYIFFCMSIQKLLRNITFVYWVGDYFPPISKTLVIFEKIKKYYHDRISYTCYLGDGVNKIMNGQIMNSFRKKTIMWAVNPKNIKRDWNKINTTLLYVGVIRSSSGLELVYDYLEKQKKYSLKVIGVCDQQTYSYHQQLIKKKGITQRVLFPNKFYMEKELNEISKTCFVGLAPYTIDNANVIYYSDPGKVKTYAEMNLPIIISNTSMIVPYIKKYTAGEVIERNVESLHSAIEKIRMNYEDYLKGLDKFNEYFYYDRYYAQKFKFLEKI